MSRLLSITLVFAIVASLGFSLSNTDRAFGASNNSDGGAVTDFGQVDTFTPVIFSVLAPPLAVKGSDGLYHIVYELSLANSNRFPWESSLCGSAGRRSQRRSALFDLG